MIEVLKPGLYTTIQDMGRFGYLEFGVPISGVMDRNSAILANKLLGNAYTDAVFECTMQGPELRFQYPTSIAITGAVATPMVNAHEVALNKKINIVSGDVLKFGFLQKGYRCYIAVKGGIQSTNVLQSRSMYKGITASEKIQKGDFIKCHQNSDVKLLRITETEFQLTDLDASILEVHKGPEFDYLAGELQNKLMEQEFTISNANNRMAYQLIEKIENKLPPIITSCVIPGTVQLTPSGQLIILMRDCQTTGGYPRILQLSDTTVNALSQKHYGHKFRFKNLN